MATPDDIAKLRLLISEPDDAGDYTDDRLDELLDGAGSPEAAAYEVWVEKASAAAGLVNVSEGGSSRSLSDLHRQAASMVSIFEKYLPTVPDQRTSTTRPIERA